MQQLGKLWDVARGSTARLVYLWSAIELLSADEALLCGLVVMMDACPPGKYPHEVACDWHANGFAVDDAREWIRAGITNPDEAKAMRESGYRAPVDLLTVPRVVAL